jgi:archaeal preflagellin peptidase FlaK
MHAEAIMELIAFVIMSVVMVSASASDWKKREVSDIHWLVMGSAGVMLFFISAVCWNGLKWEYICLAIGTGLILVDILWDREGSGIPFYVAIAILFALPLYFSSDDRFVISWASVVACYAIYMLMYVSGLLRGGADVKCLVSLSVMFPDYPEFLCFPVIGHPNSMMAHIFVFSISVLLFSATLSCLVCIRYAVMNARRGDICKRMFSGYRMDLKKAAESYVWPAEDVLDGKLVSIGTRDDSRMVFDRLMAAGYDRVWVTPMVPFIVPMTIISVALVLIGNPLLII